MQNVNPCNCSCPGQTPNAVYDQFQHSSNLRLAAASSERSADILIATTEDDTVRLSLNSQARALALTYDEKAGSQTGRSETRGTLMGVDVDRHLELSIDGDLNDRERKEIKQVLKAIFKMVKNFLSGKSGRGMDRAGAFQELETIANVSARFEAKNTAAFFSQSEVQEAARVRAPASRNGAHPADALQARPPAAEAAVYAKPTPPVGVAPSKAPVEVLAQEMTEVVKASGVDPSRIQKPVDEMFGRLMNRFLREGPFSFRRMRRLGALMEEFSRRMNLLLKPQEPEAPLPGSMEAEGVDRTGPADLFSLQQSTVRTQVRVFEQRFSFSFEYSAAGRGTTDEDEVALEA